MKRYQITLLLISIFLSNKLYGSCDPPLLTWRCVIADTQQWRYIVPGSNIIGWTNPGFNDNAWSLGKGGIGYGDNDDSTLVPTNTVSVWMRKKFTVVDTSKIEELIMAIDIDAGYVVYINGVKVHSFNMPAFVNWNTWASNAGEAALYRGQTPMLVKIPKTEWEKWLINGDNTICLQGHSHFSMPREISIRPFLFFGLKPGNTDYMSMPTWFKEPTPLYSNLPIIHIKTKGKNITDNPRIVADMDILYNGPGVRNCILNAAKNYAGKISIEYRGSTSQSMFPKKPYGFSTLDYTGTVDTNVSLLGMPKENDWIILAPYTDKTFMRDAIIHDLGRAMGRYSSRIQFIELVINDINQGVHILMEKIKIDKNRVDVQKMDLTQTSGDAISGGFIFKIDKNTGNSGPGFTSSQGLPYQYHDPEYNQLNNSMKSYLNQYVNNFESALFGPNSAELSNGYKKTASVFSFVDFMLMNELSNNIDGYRLSTYMHKDADSKCGRFIMGPYWDYNLSFGNANYCNGGTTGWQMSVGCGDHTSRYVSKMLQDPWYADITACRWEELRKTIFHKDSLFNRIDARANEIREAASRDSVIWKTLGTYVWPNVWTPPTWQNEIDSMKGWLSRRIDWMDQNMFGNTTNCGNISAWPIVISEVNFNSDSLDTSGDWIELYNTSNMDQDISGLTIIDGNKRDRYCMLPSNTIIKANDYYVVYADEYKFKTKFSSVTNSYGPLCFNLSNKGQSIIVKDLNQHFIDSMSYSDENIQLITADGWGRSINRKNYNSSNSGFNQWFTGCMGGSPGTAYQLPCAENIVINEINYASSNTKQMGDWIELYNRSSQDIDLSNWSICGNNEMDRFYISNGTILKSNEYLVLCNNIALYKSVFPGFNKNVGNFNFGLSNNGELIRLYDNKGRIHTSTYYGVGGEWIINPNGQGYTLSLKHIDSNITLAQSWEGVCLFGSPEKSNASCKSSIVEKNERWNWYVTQNKKGQVELNIDSDEKLGCTLIVSDAMGRTFLKINLPIEKGESRYSWEISRAGVYSVSMQWLNGSIQTKRVMVE